MRVYASQESVYRLQKNEYISDARGIMSITAKREREREIVIEERSTWAVDTLSASVGVREKSGEAKRRKKAKTLWLR